MLYWFTAALASSSPHSCVMLGKIAVPVRAFGVFWFFKDDWFFIGWWWFDVVLRVVFLHPFFQCLTDSVGNGLRWVLLLKDILKRHIPFRWFLFVRRVVPVVLHIIVVV